MDWTDRSGRTGLDWTDRTGYRPGIDWQRTNHRAVFDNEPITLSLLLLFSGQKRDIGSYIPVTVSDSSDSDSDGDGDLSLNPDQLDPKVNLFDKNAFDPTPKPAVKVGKSLWRFLISSYILWEKKLTKDRQKTYSQTKY